MDRFRFTLRWSTLWGFSMLAALPAQVLSAPDEFASLRNLVLQDSETQLRAINAHLWDGRHQNLTNRDESTSHNQLALFASASQSDGQQQRTDRQKNHDLDAESWITAVDGLISDWTFGFGYGESDTEQQFSDQVHTSALNDHYLVYTSWYFRQFAVDTVLGHTQGDIESSRFKTDATAMAEIEQELTYLSVKGSYDFKYGNLTYGSMSSLLYVDGKIEGFTETGASAFNTTYSEQGIESLEFMMGLHGTYAIQFGWGLIAPYGQIEWHTERRHKPSPLEGQLVNQPAQTVSVQLDKPDTSWYQILAGLTIATRQGLSAYVSYESWAKYKDQDLETITFGLRGEFL